MIMSDNNCCSVCQGGNTGDISSSKPAVCSTDLQDEKDQSSRSQAKMQASPRFRPIKFYISNFPCSCLESQKQLSGGFSVCLWMFFLTAYASCWHRPRHWMIRESKEAEAQSQRSAMGTRRCFPAAKINLLILLLTKGTEIASLCRRISIMYLEWVICEAAIWCSTGRILHFHNSGKKCGRGLGWSSPTSVCSPWMDGSPSE